MATKKQRIIIADDHEISLRGLRSLLNEIPGFEVVAIAFNGEELVNQCRLHEPDIVLTDIKMPEKDGVAATREILSFLPATLILGISIYEEDYSVLEILKAGARGFIPKGAEAKQIAEALSQAGKSEGYYCGTASVALHELLKKYTHKKLPVHIGLHSKRELEVLQLVCDGYTTQEIADKLFISPTTVSGHRAKLLEKADCSNTASLIMYAQSNGLYVKKF